MSGLAQGAAGMLALLCLAGVVTLSRNPDRTIALLARLAGVAVVAAFAIFLYRGDLFRPSGLDDSSEGACGYERVC